jgi:hypothetical protein
MFKRLLEKMLNIWKIWKLAVISATWQQHLRVACSHPESGRGRQSARFPGPGWSSGPARNYRDSISLMERHGQLDIYKHAFKVLPAFIYCILALNLIFILIKVYEIKVLLALLFITVNIDRKGIDAKKKMISK